MTTSMADNMPPVAAASPYLHNRSHSSSIYALSKPKELHVKVISPRRVELLPITTHKDSSTSTAKKVLAFLLCWTISARTPTSTFLSFFPQPAPERNRIASRHQ
jgi:hypothetical protein